MRYTFPHNPSQMEPLVLESDTALLEKCYAIATASAKLSSLLPPASAMAISKLVSQMNCYYSNLIEGHQTKPIDIERALYSEYSRSPQKRILQLEARAHIEVEQYYLKLARQDIFSADFICAIHRALYEKLPEDLHWITQADGKQRKKINAGSLRESEVQVGQHYPPHHQALPAFMSKFESSYQSAWQNKLPYQRIPLLAYAHHRLLWIHPFLDGNGRVARLHSLLAIQQAGIDGIGLWSPARGLARNVQEYRAYLQEADSLRRGDLDGRGNLSAQALQSFSAFFVATCLDQISFMSEMLDLAQLSQRIQQGFAILSTSQQIKSECAKLVIETLLKGEITRGEAARITGFSERTARDMLSELLQLGFLQSDSPKGSVRIAFPAAMMGFYFPNLFPTGSPDEIGHYIARKRAKSE